MVRVIINADDLGLSQRVNDAVFGLMAAGRLTSATIMSGGAALEDAARRCREFPKCSFGVHLCLTELRPETRDPALGPLLKPDGEFTDKAHQTPMTPALVAAIEREWIAQIEKVRALGVPISHLDGHHHIHTHGRLVWALKRVQRATGITRVRTTMNLYPPDEPMRGGLKRRLLKAAWRGVLEHGRPRTTTTDIFCGFRAYHQRLPNVPAARTVELMVHPGADLPVFREEERLMVTPWEQRSHEPVELISFNDL